MGRLSGALGQPLTLTRLAQQAEQALGCGPLGPACMLHSSHTIRTKRRIAAGRAAGVVRVAAAAPPASGSALARAGQAWPRISWPHRCMHSATPRIPCTAGVLFAAGTTAVTVARLAPAAAAAVRCTAPPGLHEQAGAMPGAWKRHISPYTSLTKALQGPGGAREAATTSVSAGTLPGWRAKSYARGGLSGPLYDLIAA